MPSTFNREQVVALTEKLEKARAIYFTDYLGLDVSSVTELRKIFFEENLEFYILFKKYFSQFSYTAHI